MKIVWVCLLAASAALPSTAQSISWGKAVQPHLPAGWAAYMTHSGGAPDWQLVRDPSTKGKPVVLAQLSTDATSRRFPLAIFAGLRMLNGSLSVRTKAVAGKEDQAGGIVLRFQDADNYYLVRANALEDNIVFYKVQEGVRTALVPVGAAAGTHGAQRKVPAGVWNLLAVSFAGSHFKVSFNGEQLFEVEDTTFTTEGRVGLWTKADSVTWFREFTAAK